MLVESCNKAFVAEVNGTVVGSVSCQLFAGLYPHVIAEQYRKYGYIWVYVEPPHRGQGPEPYWHGLDHLKLLNSRVILHALHWENQSTPASASESNGWI